MLFKKLLSLSISLIFSCGYVQVAQAEDLECKDKFSYAACGSLVKTDIDRLKKKLDQAKKAFKSPQPVYLYDVQAILGFSGEQTKTTNNGTIEHRIWIDSDNSRRQVKASFLNEELVQIKTYGF
ncbi:MAG: hypothetical protein RLZZ381_2772 [Cyanobacteriota bacterium]|jgi:hypothetical protein